MTQQSWLTVCGEDDPARAQALEERVRNRVAAGNFKTEDLRYIEKLSLPVVSGSLAVSEKTLERLRRLCQLWEVDIKATKIESHRKFVGPCIVAGKRILFTLLRTLLKEQLRQQRDFNAATVVMLAQLAQDIERDSSQRTPGGVEKGDATINGMSVADGGR